MVAQGYFLAALLMCVAVNARHNKPEPSADISPDTHPAHVDIPVEPDRRHRRKRWYSSYGYPQPIYREDMPPAPPAPPPGPAPYDPFAYIYRRLDELTALIRQPVPPQAPVLVPYPVYIGQGCGCPGSSRPQEPSSNATGMTFPNRLGEGDNGNDDYDDMPIRPLDFNPVKPDRPLTRPVPSVEHGSTQAGSTPGQQAREPAQFAAGFGGNSAATTPQPSRCDIATLTCCHQRYTNNQCFANFGCQSALRQGNPCDAKTLSNVVSVFQNFYRNNS